MTIDALKALCARISWCQPAVLESVLELALEIAREGREGRRIGTLFTVGKVDSVLAASRALILDPLAGHAPQQKHITNPNLRGTIKELAQLDGAFVISETGIVVAACRYLDASVEQIDLPLGFGSRHLAAASISKRIGAVAIVVSEIVFDQGLDDLFVIRVAGNIASSQIGSVEFAAERFGTPLVLVLGHSRYGAVLATLEDLTMPSEKQSRSLR